MLSEAKESMKSVRVWYENNYEDILRLQREIIKEGDFVYVREKRRYEKEVRHELSEVAKGLNRVGGAIGSMVAIKKKNRYVKNLLQSGVVVAPASQTREEVQ